MKYKNESIKIKIDDTEYWFMQDEDGSGAIALLEHCDDKGELIFGCFSSDSFAYVTEDRKIMRYNNVIGNIDKLT